MFYIFLLAFANTPLMQIKKNHVASKKKEDLLYLIYIDEVMDFNLQENYANLMFPFSLQICLHIQ